MSTAYSRNPSMLGFIIILSVPKTTLRVNAEPPGFSLDCRATTNTSSLGFNISRIFSISSKSTLSIIAVSITYQKKNNDTDKKLNYTNIMKEELFRQSIRQKNGKFHDLINNKIFCLNSSPG